MMDSREPRDVLEALAAGRISVEQAMDAMRHAPVLELAAGVVIDPHRKLRAGQGEVVFGRDKSDEQLAVALQGFRDAGQPALATKLSPEQGARLVERFPDARFHAHSGLLALDIDLRLDALRRPAGAEPPAETLVVTAGASDMGVALEALGAARFMGLEADLISDVGVAGIHRLTSHLPALAKARCVIAVAGMEGALPSVLAGLIARPIVAVPTSVGYGANFQGLAPLLSMLNSCAPGVAAVNIDNGYGAAAFAAKMTRD